MTVFLKLLVAFLASAFGLSKVNQRKRVQWSHGIIWLRGQPLGADSDSDTMSKILTTMAVIGKNGGGDGGSPSGQRGQRGAVAAVTATVILLPHPQKAQNSHHPLSCSVHILQPHLYQPPPGAGTGSPAACR